MANWQSDRYKFHKHESTTETLVASLRACQGQTASKENEMQTSAHHQPINSPVELNHPTAASLPIKDIFASKQNHSSHESGKKLS